MTEALPRSAFDRVLLGDRYEIGDLIGSGGMGRVHEGRDRVLGRPIAVKILDGARAADPRAVESFRGEARAAAALHHPNVVSVFDSGSEDGVHYIVMERVRGRTLRDVLATEGPFDPDRASAVAQEMAAALAAAHDRGLVHRDVKPGNVMLTEDGSVKVMDFGIARAADERSRTGGLVLGTAAYLAPEQARGQSVTPAGDVYSLGCVLYEMLTGRPPFVGETPVATVYSHVHESAVPPSEIVDGVPATLEAVVLRSMAKEPEGRYRDGREFGAALTAAGHDTAPIAVQRDGPGASPSRSGSRRLPVGALGVGAILLIAFLITPGFISSRSDAPPTRAEAATEVEVPDVVGMTATEAIEVLTEAGLIPQVLDGALDDGVEYRVVEQDPAAGARVERRSFVALRLTPAGGGDGSGSRQDGERSGGEGSERGRGQSAGDDRGSDRGRPAPGGGGAGPDPEESPTPDPTPTPTRTPSPEPTPSPSPTTPADAGLV